MQGFQHNYKFDPSYGYDLQALLKVGVPEMPANFEAFWRQRYGAALEVDPAPVLEGGGEVRDGWKVYDLRYRSTDGVQIGGWCLLPEHGRVERVFVVMHGYGGREEPDFDLPFENAAILFPCARGISRSPHESISWNPRWHVLHDIQDYQRYVHGGCVEDVWLGVSSALRLFPEARGRVGLLGISFGGGIGAMALAWDSRIVRAHFNVPSFGNNALRLKLRTTGSGRAVRVMHHRIPELVEKTLSYYDSASAARWIRQPVHFALALFDPMVAPPGQFAVYNAVPGTKQLYVLKAGHFDYEEEAEQKAALLIELGQFFRWL